MIHAVVWARPTLIACKLGGLALCVLASGGIGDLSLATNGLHFQRAYRRSSRITEDPLVGVWFDETATLVGFGQAEVV